MTENSDTLTGYRTRITPNGHVEVVTVTAEQGLYREVIEPGDEVRLRAVLPPAAADEIAADPAFSDPANRPVSRPVVVVVPASATNFQVRAILMQQPGRSAGRTLFDEVDAAVRAQGGVALQAWEYANDITRAGALVNAMAQQMGLSAEQLDQLFIEAAGFQA